MVSNLSWVPKLIEQLSVGYVSFRQEDGSWFIKALCEVLSDAQYDHYELTAKLTVVTRKVALNFKSSTTDPTKNGMKQNPVLVNTLIRFLRI